MPAYAQYRISEKKCATCSYWGGQREIQLVHYKPMYIKAFAGNSTCLAMHCPSSTLLENGVKTSCEPSAAAYVAAAPPQSRNARK